MSWIAWILNFLFHCFPFSDTSAVILALYRTQVCSYLMRYEMWGLLKIHVTYIPSRFGQREKTCMYLFVLCLFHLCFWQRIVTLIKDPAACHVWTIPFQRFFWGNPNTVCQFWQNYELKCVPHTSHSVDRQWSQSLVMFWITANTSCISHVKGGLDSTSRPISRQS